MLALWYLSLFVSIIALAVGIVKKSWTAFLISSLTFLPIAYYFWGANNAWKMVGLTPILLLLLTFYMKQKKRIQH